MRRSMKCISTIAMVLLAVLTGSLAWNRTQPRDAENEFKSGKLEVSEEGPGIIWVGTDELDFRVRVQEKGPADDRKSEQRLL